VFKVRLILVTLICAFPVILLWDGLIMQGLVAGIVAVALAITAQTLRPGETSFTLSIIRPVAALAAVPALRVLVQVIPLKALAHPIWTSAETAVGHSVAGGLASILARASSRLANISPRSQWRSYPPLSPSIASAPSGSCSRSPLRLPPLR
jgi:hypothetical protein